MQKQTGMGYPAVNIEHAFAIFLGKQIGKRGEHYDADFFRAGDRKQLGKALQAAAKRLQARVNKISFTAAELQDGGAKARLDNAIKDINDIATDMTKSTMSDSAEDYHWIIIGDLILALDSILVHFGV